MFCHSCRCHVTPTPPKTAWKFVNTGFWIASLIVALIFSLALPLNLVLAPAAVIIGLAVGTSARRLNDWTCPHCHADLVEPDPLEDMVPTTTQWRRARPPARPSVVAV